MQLMAYVMLFLLGSCIASFLTTLAYRLSCGLSLRELLLTRSRCESCDAVLRWFELVPVFSYTLQRGQCRQCGQLVTLWYPTGELLLGLVFLSFFMNDVFFVYYVVAVVLFYLAALDVLHNRIPKDLLHGLLLLALPYYFFSIFTYSQFGMTLGVFLPLLEAIVLVSVLAVINKVRLSFGTADLLILIFLSFFALPEPGNGLWLMGFGWIFKVFFLSAVVAVLSVLPLIVQDKKWLKKRIPFIPFIFIGYSVVVVLYL